MTPNLHTELVVNRVSDWVEHKYTAGQREHGGELWRKPVLEHLVEEAVDQSIYLVVLVDQVREATARLYQFLADPSDPGASLLVQEAYNILQHGNPEGESSPELNPSEVRLIK